MRIAVLGDIHGNLMALDAVMTDIEKQAPDQTWCLGDLAWAGPWGSECIARVREAGWPTVRGNTDVWITGDPQTIEDEAQRQHFREMAEAHAISEDDARWLLDRPLGHSGPGSILMVHGTPQSPFVAPEPDAPPAEFKAYEDAAQVVVYGHVHVAFIRQLHGGTTVANTGAVGIPKDGDTASYLLIDRIGPDISLRHRRVEFDRRAGIAQARAIGGPIGKRFLENMGVAE
jgi:predicted phosphodiesterase